VRTAIAWFARNPVAANLAMVVIVVSGLVTLPTIRQELIPDLELDIITITIVYPGASPQEIEQSITLRVEEELQGLQGVKKISSNSAESLSIVTVELLAGENVQRRLDDVRSAVDSIDTFPDDVEEPQITQVEERRRVLQIAIAGDADDWTLKRLGQQVRDEIASLPRITDVELGSTLPYEISIEVSEAALRRYGLTFDDVSRAVERSSMDLPAGSVKTSSGEIMLRAKGQAYRARDFERIPLVLRPDGTRLEVRHVATVIDGFEESDQRVRFDGAPAVTVQVYRVGKQRSLEVSRTVAAYLEEAQYRMPEGISLTIWDDDARVLRDRLDTLLRNARGGFILVVLSLAFFLRLRLAMWVSLGIPISFLGAIALMPPLDMSINFVSLLAFIVVLGVVVDDAIVVGESVHTEQERTGDKLGGAVAGTLRISVPVIFGVLTTIAAFTPMLFLPGPMGRISRVVPVVVICCLVLSLFESMFILPAHLGHGRKALGAPPTTAISKRWRRLQDRVNQGLQSLIHGSYLPTLKAAIYWRYLTLAISLSLLLVTAGLLGGGWLKFVFQAPVEADFIVADLTMIQGTPAAVTTRAMERMEAAVLALRAEVDATRPEGAVSIFPHIMTQIGSQPFSSQTGPPGSLSKATTSSDIGEIQVDVVSFKDRDISVTELTRRWRERVGEIPGALEVSFSSTILEAGAAIEVELRGPDLALLSAAAEAVKERLGAYSGVIEITDSFRGGKQELEIQILPSAESLGVTLADLAHQVRQGFYGDEVQSIQRGRDEVKVMVRYPARERRSLADVTNMRIRSMDGSEIPFSTVALAKLDTGFSSIRRVNRQRVVTVKADVDRAVANSNEIVADLKGGSLQAVLDDYPGLTFSFEGEQAEQRDFLRAQLIGLAGALLVIYVLLAIPLGSYLQPLIIMSAIPFGFVGAAWGHLLLGYDLSMYSILGLVALSGVVVNASLVLVDQVNFGVAGGMEIRAAVYQATVARFRPILLTSLTTFLGLTPLMMETSIQARFMIPMAISLAFGVLFASFITLLLVPTAYLVLEDVQKLLGRFSGSSEAGFDEAKSTKIGEDQARSAAGARQSSSSAVR